jgi:hypothetical protein
VVEVDPHLLVDVLTLVVLVVAEQGVQYIIVVDLVVLELMDMVEVEVLLETVDLVVLADLVS